MKHTPVIVVATLFLSQISFAQKLIQKTDLESFASSFQCKNPKLQWQFDHMVSLWDDNFRMQALKNRGAKDIIYEASGVGGRKGWLYRGVTNQQFNESQILALIFNDSTQVSESRWLSGQMLKNANIDMGANFVQARSKFREISLDTRWKFFQDAFDAIDSKILKLASNIGKVESAFQEHLQIGNRYNGTPEAIQFLTPHKDYAEGYGEFVLHVKEVVKRGIDVERYNYHNPNLSYSLGSIYRMDQDEYAVPGQIPSWDIQAVKVRTGAVGWHRGSYGEPAYYYTKIYEDKNPCNVIGVRVDVTQGGTTPDDQDDDRVPVGMILRCWSKNAADCKSDWNTSKKISELNNLQSTISETKIDDQPLYFVPYEEYEKKSPLYRLGLTSPIEILRTKPAGVDDATYKQVVDSLRDELEERICSKEYLVKKNLEEFFEYAVLTHSTKSACFNDLLMRMSSNMLLHDQVVVLATKYKSSPLLSAVNLTEIKNVKINPYESMEPLEVVQAIGLKKRAESDKNDLAKAMAKIISQDESNISTAISYLNVDSETAQNAIDGGLLLAIQNKDAYPISNPFGTWNTIQSVIKDSTHPESTLGLCIEYAIANTSMTPVDLLNNIAKLGLPKEREIDTVRAVWQRSKDLTLQFNRYSFYAISIREWFLQNIIANFPNQKDLLNQTIVDLFQENINPPAPFLGYASVVNLKKMSSMEKTIPLWTGEANVTYKVGNIDVVIPQFFYETALGQSLSEFYLESLLRFYETAKNDSLKATVKSTIKGVIASYKRYCLNGLLNDLQDPFNVALLKERNDWKQNENVIRVVNTLMNLSSTTATEKASLKTVRDALVDKLPSMKTDDQSQYEKSLKAIEKE